MIAFLTRLLLFLVLIYLAVKAIFKKSKSRPRNRSKGELVEMKKDQICGTFVPENQALTCHHQGELHYFCSKECRDRFLKSGH